MRKYTKEQLIFYLKKLASELNKSPTIKDMNKRKKYPSASTYVKRYGSWNKALKKVGLKVNVRKEYNKTELIDNLKNLAKELGRKPKTKDLKQWMGSSATYRKIFGSWKKALKTAGLKKESFLNLRQFTKKRK